MDSGYYRFSFMLRAGGPGDQHRGDEPDHRGRGLRRRHGQAQGARRPCSDPTSVHASKRFEALQSASKRSASLLDARWLHRAWDLRARRKPRGCARRGRRCDAGRGMSLLGVCLLDAVAMWLHRAWDRQARPQAAWLRAAGAPLRRRPRHEPAGGGLCEPRVSAAAPRARRARARRPLLRPVHTAPLRAPPAQVPGARRLRVQGRR